MAVRTESQLVTYLKLEVERAFGHPVSTPSDFIQVAALVESKTHEHISDSTIKRLWKPALAYKTVSERTLNVISSFLGYSSFRAFCDSLAGLGLDDSEMSRAPSAIFSGELTRGVILEIAWLPDRECTLKYLGDLKFEVIREKNASISEGDTFLCASFAKGRPLYADNLYHQGELIGSYVMGKQHGLTKAVIVG